LTVPSPKPPGAAFKSNAAVRWISPKPPGRETVLRVAEDGNAACRVFIVDRDSMSSDLLANALVRDSGFEAAVIQAGDLLDALMASEVELVVIGAEVSLKSGNGFDLAENVARAHPKTAIVILLNQPTHESVVNAFRSGARGVFSRQQPMAEFLDCVAHVGRGFIWAGRQETEFLLSAFKNIPSPNLMTSSDAPTLTAREMQVVQCAATGKTNKIIAGELGLSEHTVKNYLFRAFEKLGVSSRVELLFYLTIRGQTFSAAKGKSATADLSADLSAN
jgi:two-component system, NarL family, nitrate/nitrite response regulator NarL